MRRLAVSGVVVAASVVALVGVLSCEKDEVLLPDQNLPPETELTKAPPESTQTNFRVHMFWHGKDPDGVVTSFRYAMDDTIEIGSWQRTSRRDTTFILSANDPLLRYHEFYIASVDNEGKADPTPSVRRFFARDDSMPRVWMLDYPYCLVSGADTLACLPPPLGVDTLLMTDTRPIVFAWDGVDGDGQIVSFAYKLDNEGYQWVDSTTTQATYPSASELPQGPHSFYIKARDDAQAEMTPSYRYRFVVNKDPETVLDSLYYAPSGYSLAESLIVVNVADSEPDTLPDACRIRVTWHSSDIDGEITRSLVQLRGPDLLRQQDWSSGWIAYSQDTTMWWHSPRLDGTLDGPFILKAFAMDNRRRSEGTPATLEFPVNFPPDVFNLQHAMLDSLELTRTSPPDTTVLYDVSWFDWQAQDRDNDSTEIYFYYILDGRTVIPAGLNGIYQPDIQRKHRYWYEEISAGTHTLEVRGHNYSYDPRVRYGSTTLTFTVSK